MGKKDVESVCKKMALTNGTLWPIPIVFDITNKEIEEKGIKKKIISFLLIRVIL